MTTDLVMENVEYIYVFSVFTAFVKKLIDSLCSSGGPVFFKTWWVHLKMFLKPVWEGKIHGVGVYATHSVRIWWFRNKVSLFQLKRM